MCQDFGKLFKYVFVLFHINRFFAVTVQNVVLRYTSVVSYTMVYDKKCDD